VGAVVEEGSGQRLAEFWILGEPVQGSIDPDP